MPIVIEGGANSTKVNVNKENQLDVLAVTHDQDFHINLSNGKNWSIPFEGLNPTGADDYVVYIKNTGDAVIHITDIRVMCDTAVSQLELHAVSGDASGGTAISPVSKTIGSAALPTATIESGSNITGLTNDGVVYFIQCAVVNTEYHLKTSATIRIPKGKAVGLLVETATANVTGVISISEEAEL